MLHLAVAVIELTVCRQHLTHTHMREITFIRFCDVPSELLHFACGQRGGKTEIKCNKKQSKFRTIVGNSD